MVTTTTSGVGWATSMLPAPVWVKPLRCGVTCPCRAPRLIEAGGGAGAAGVTVIVTGLPGGTGVGAWANNIGRGNSKPSNPVSIFFMVSGSPSQVVDSVRMQPLPAQNQIGSGSE